MTTLWGERLGVAEEGFEAVVHVWLDVAVEEGEAGLVGGELDLARPYRGMMTVSLMTPEVGLPLRSTISQR